MHSDLTDGANGACAQVDVEAVMTYIRDRAERRRQGAGEGESVPVADGLTPAPLLDQQAEFNQRVTHALESITRYLQSISPGDAGLAEPPSRAVDSSVVARGAGPEQAVERELGALRAEAASTLAQLAEQVQAGVAGLGEQFRAAAAQQAQVVAGLDGRLDELGAMVAASRSEADSALAQTSRLQQTIGDEFAILGTRLEARLTRLEQDVQADYSRQMEVAQSVDTRLDAVLSRLESLAEAVDAAARAPDPAEALGAQLARIEQRLEQVEAQVESRLAALQEQVSAVSAAQAQQAELTVARLDQLMAAVELCSEAAGSTHSSQALDVEQATTRAVVPVADSLRADFERLQAHVADAAAQRETAAAEVAGRVGHMIAQLEALAPRVDAVTAEMVHLAHDLEEGLAQLTVRLLRVERVVKAGRPASAAATSRASATPSPSGPSDEPRPSARPWASALDLSREPSRGNGLVDQPFDYVTFEQTFRGPRSEIRRRQQYYVDLFRDRGRVVDLGCGRGEFVELLAEQGIDVLGVDSNEDMVLFCQDSGVPIVQADMLQYLAEQSDGSLEGVFACQIVEHLSPDQILHLVQVCGEKLQPGGVLVAETINPHCPVALSNFYLDPTHVRPVPPQLLAFMMAQSGFAIDALYFSAPSAADAAPALTVTGRDLPEESRLYQDYAVIATRRGTPTAGLLREADERRQSHRGA